MCIKKNGISFYYEVEINEKIKESLAQWVYARAKFLNEVDPNTKKELVLWTPHDRIIRNYKSAFSGKIYPAKFSKELNKYVIRTDHEPIRTDLSKIRFVKAIKDPSRKSGGYIKDMSQGRKYQLIEGL